MTLVTPAGGGAHRPLLVFLYGLYYDNNSQLTDQMFAALHALGPRAPDIAFPYGDQSYWINSASGAWASYVLDEVIPKALKVLHADPRRVAIGGISMGGFGAYAIARLDPGRFCAVGGHSAAIDPVTFTARWAAAGVRWPGRSRWDAAGRLADRCGARRDLDSCKTGPGAVLAQGTGRARVNLEAEQR